ncbi:Right handed beta helix region [Pontibacter akesuensis]|uniref:Right handed beta helix region n=2 Tax=Pontibacter akesuensis TaxID=388950 RepID=A0A1I7FUX5_9BACT|nr:Right handed beta helix region [Pontibacter akesuensis]
MMGMGVPSAMAETYYISPQGNDGANSGTSLEQPWQTITKVNATRFAPGDTILFKGGATFQGSIQFLPGAGGTADKPIVLSSYGTGKAIISSGTLPGLKVYNAAGFKVVNLIFEGSGQWKDAQSHGIDFYMDLPNNTRLDFIAIDSVEVSGYRLTGISVGSWKGASGYDNISITNSSVHDNGDAGIATYAEATLGHRNLYVGYNKVYNNSGLPEKTDLHSGNGILVGGVDGAVVEFCEAYNNGWLNAWTTGGPVGIWGYHCNNLVIQYNESHHNKTGTTKDGGGFDIDGGCTDCTMQYNYSHDNEGAGYLVAQYVNAPPMKGVTIRYNISENDGRSNGYGAIHLWSSGANGGIQDLHIYNNTVYLSPAESGDPKALYVQEGGKTVAYIRNNIFQTTGGLEVVQAQQTSDLRLEGNNYWAGEGNLKINWNGSTYTSLTDWRAATGQEMLPDSAVGLTVAPLLKKPGQGIILADPRKLHTLTGYELQDTSWLIGKGLDLQKLYSIAVGPVDFFGNDLTSRKAFSIGAHQPEVVPLPVTFVSFRVYRKGNRVELAWETATEQNNKGFEVEVSEDGQQFRPIGFVPSKSPDSQVRQAYNFTHANPGKKGTRYYRLKQLDLDDTTAYSTVCVVEVRAEGNGMIIYPNPFEQDFLLQIYSDENQKLHLALSGMKGRKLLEQTLQLQEGNNFIRIAPANLKEGTLFLLSATFGGETHQVKMFKR